MDQNLSIGSMWHAAFLMPNSKRWILADDQLYEVVNFLPGEKVAYRMVRDGDKVKFDGKLQQLGAGTWSDEGEEVVDAHGGRVRMVAAENTF